MANRPIFIPSGDGRNPVLQKDLSFIWNPGFSVSQKKKNIVALHNAALDAGYPSVLEVSTKSESELGRRLSAFSLKIETEVGKITVESAFQGSKVFRDGGPYTDIYRMPPHIAKRDSRLRNSGKLTGFDFFGQEWPLEPKTAFYDYLYFSAIYPHKEYLKRLYKYDAFSDIEFNPKKSINCQARSIALFLYMLKTEQLDKAMKSRCDFLACIGKRGRNEKTKT